MKQDELQLQEEIKSLNDERQEFITKACKGYISDEEFTSQIGAVCDQELGVMRRLTAIQKEKESFEKLDMEEQVKKYVIEL